MNDCQGLAYHSGSEPDSQMFLEVQTGEIMPAPDTGTYNARRFLWAAKTMAEYGIQNFINRDYLPRFKQENTAQN